MLAAVILITLLFTIGIALLIRLIALNHGIQHFHLATTSKPLLALLLDKLSR